MLRKLYFILSIVLFAVPVTQAQEPDAAMGLEVVARINAWRVDEGLWPLRPNPTLAAMALDQALYVVSLPDLPDDLHVGRTGMQPRQRALVPPYEWPHYELPGQIAIGENAGLGTVSSALRYWQNSALHTRTTLNAAYREIGVAAVPYNGQHFIIVVFGSRPNVLPALVDPTEERSVFLSSEEFEYANNFNAIRDATEVMVFDTDGRPLYDEPVAWANEITVPESAGDEVFILLSDGEHEVLSAVDFDEDQAILPGYLPGVAVVDVGVPDAKPTPIGSIEDAVQEAQPAPVEPTPAAPTPEPTTAPPDLLILYTGDTLDVLNVSGVAMDWQALELVGGVTFSFSQWARVTDIPLGAIPPNHCAQIRSGGITGDVVVPDGCRWVRSLIQIGADRLFWALGPFEVRRNGVTLATCQPGAGVCPVSVP